MRINPKAPKPQLTEALNLKLFHLDPKSMQNNGLNGCSSGFRAILLHTFGV